ncbi:hypothetical protein M0R88_01360 [Halorussus gelatinilyticus]|uniref:Uncharacterized protein n=1 Tax=Halorussus gelatinilyticus TaxID=2937524 RepID=A0A8U0IJB0_9EURY|nr:hypothetical protein [Halorussus gelatinilyticus]UPW00765.1 hypothetical protein M0R88_01360 [Halorussus gelatinilyticus]
MIDSGLNGGLDRTTKFSVGAAGATRAAAGGMLAIALAVFVGRRSSPLAVGVLVGASSSV